jgi:type II secretory pathway component PulF
MARNLATVYHNLSVMLEAGMPVVRSVNTTASGLKEGRLRKAFSAIAQAVSNGQTMANTMAKYPNVFAPLDILVVEAAEDSGNLPQSLNLLSKWHDFRKRLRRIILSGMLLPFLVLTLAVLIVPLPGFILSSFNTSRYLQQVVSNLAIFYIPAMVIFSIVRFTPTTGPLRALLDAVVIRIPLLGQAVRHLAISRYCRVFNMLYKAGIPIVQCAEKTPDVTGNSVVADLLKGGSESARAGNPVCDGFSQKLPADFIEIWRTGEETGKLDDITKRLADTNAETAEWMLETFAKWLPRIVYCLVCIWMIVKIFENFGRIYSGYTSF